MDRKNLKFKFRLSPLLPSSFAFSSKKGFTVVELLTSMLISLLILGAISVAFIGADRGFKKNRPISQAIQEAQNSVATLDFLFSRWGIGVPESNAVYLMDSNGLIKKDQNGDPVTWQPSNLPDGVIFSPGYPFWYQAIDTNDDGNDDSLYFFASLGGSGYVDSCTNDAPHCNILSCRLTSKDNANKCYFIFSTDGTIKYYALSDNDIDDDDIDCSSLQDDQTYNTIINIGGLKPADRFQRVPHLVKIYEIPIDNKTSWLAFDKIDIAYDCNDNENGVLIGKIRKGSFLITPVSRYLTTPISQMGQNAIKIQADFVDESGSITYKFSRVYAK